MGKLALHFAEYRRQIFPISKMTEAAAAKPAKAKKPAKKAEHPPSGVMVLAAVKALKDKKGSSLPAIKKYIAANYKVDVAKISPFIRKAIKKLVADKNSSKPRLASRPPRKRNPRRLRSQRQRNPRPRSPKRPLPRRPQKRRPQPKRPQRSPQPKRAQRRQQRKPHPKRSRC